MITFRGWQRVLRVSFIFENASLWAYKTKHQIYMDKSVLSCFCRLRQLAVLDLIWMDG